MQSEKKKERDYCTQKKHDDNTDEIHFEILCF
jgi:hypothetical protein